jgi:hypothetical protein
MDFFYKHNLVMDDFFSIMVSWKMGGQWSAEITGYPALELDISKGRVNLVFLATDSKTPVFRLRTDEFEISPTEAKDSILFESKYDDLDRAIIFKRKESCERLHALVMQKETKCSLKSQ